MTFKIRIKEVNVETVKNGKNSYGKAEVIYDFQGNTRSQKILSFANPSIFAKVQQLKPAQEVVVTVTKNDKGFNEWASLEASSDAPAAVAEPAKRVTSTYETAEERKIKQLYIIKQSSISNALTYLKDTAKENDTSYSVSDVLDTAQAFVDFVYGNNDPLTLESMSSDIPE